MSGCSTCPEIVLGVLSEDVWDTMRRIQRINEIVRIFNRFFQEVSTRILQEIQDLINLIPDPPFLDLKGLIDLLTCPLLPQAFVVEQADRLIYYVETKLKDTPILARPPLYGPTIAAYSFKESLGTSALPPASILRKYGQIAQSMLEQIERLIDQALVVGGDITGMTYASGNPSYNANMEEQGITKPPFQPATVFGTNAGQGTGQTIYPQFDKGRAKSFQFSPEASIAFKVGRRLIRDMLRELDSADTFVVKLALTTASVEMIKVTCPAIYRDSRYPFMQYETTAGGFSFNGIVPSGFDSQANQMAEILMTLQRKIAEWQTAAFVGGVG